MERAPGESLPAAQTVDLAPAEADNSTAAPAVVATPPAPEPTATAVASLPEPLISTAAAKPAPAAASVDRQVAMTPPKPAPAESAPKQIAMLPPKPVVVRQPQPKLTAQPEPSATGYVAQPGDCLFGIAAAHGVTPAQLAQMNDLRPPYVIRVGQRLTVPERGVYVNGERLTSDVPSLFTEDTGHHLVPLRAIVERVGGTVSWEPAARQAKADARGHRITVTIGSRQAGVDGKSATLVVAPAIVANRTLVPARFLGDAFDLSVTYARGVTRIAAK